MNEAAKLGIILKDIIILNPSIETLLCLRAAIEKHAQFKVFMKGVRTNAGVETEGFNLDERKLLEDFQKAIAPPKSQAPKSGSAAGGVR